MTGIPHLLVHEHDDNVGVVVVEDVDALDDDRQRNSTRKTDWMT